jgi:hypothetical protein
MRSLLKTIGTWEGQLKPLVRARSRAIAIGTLRSSQAAVDRLTIDCRSPLKTLTTGCLSTVCVDPLIPPALHSSAQRSLGLARALGSFCGNCDAEQKA